MLYLSEKPTVIGMIVINRFNISDVCTVYNKFENISINLKKY